MLTLFIASLCLVFLLGIQQQNVTGGHHGWSVATSFAIAGAQVAFIQTTAAGGYWESVAPMGAGGALGASLSMVVHRRFIRREVGYGRG